MTGVTLRTAVARSSDFKCIDLDVDSLAVVATSLRAWKQNLPVPVHILAGKPFPCQNKKLLRSLDSEYNQKDHQWTEFRIVGTMPRTIRFLCKQVKGTKVRDMRTIFIKKIVREAAKRLESSNKTRLSNAASFHTVDHARIKIHHDEWSRVAREIDNLMVEVDLGSIRFLSEYRIERYYFYACTHENLHTDSDAPSIIMSELGICPESEWIHLIQMHVGTTFRAREGESCVLRHKEAKNILNRENMSRKHGFLKSSFLKFHGNMM